MPKFILFIGACVLTIASSFLFTQTLTTEKQPEPPVQVVDSFSLSPEPAPEIAGDTQPLTAEQVSFSGFDATSFPMDSKGFQRYTSGFGYRVHPISGNARFHYGLDLAGPMGAQLYAWAGGTVTAAVKVDNNPCGLYVTIQSGEWSSVYCHCISVEVSAGDVVQAGQPVGKLGSTGSSTGPHLHWGLKYQNKWLDPNVVLLQLKANQAA